MEEKTTFQKIMGFINKAGGFITLNLLFLVCCLPLVTIGPAWKGLYGGVRYTIRGDGWFDGFKTGFCHKFLRTAIGFTIALSLLLFAGTNLLGIARVAMAHWGWDILPDLLIHGLFFLVALLVSTAMLPVGLYFEADVNTWLMNAWDLILHAPVQVLLSGVLMWAPVGLFLYDPVLFYLLLIVFIAVYFILAAFIMTGFLKNPLIRILNRIRAENGEDKSREE